LVEILVFRFRIFFNTFLYFLTLAFVGLAPLASYSFSTAKKSNQKMPPLLLTPLQKTQGFPFRSEHYHAGPELAKYAQTAGPEDP